MFPCQLSAPYVSWWPMFVRVTPGGIASEGLDAFPGPPVCANHVGVAGSLLLFGSRGSITVVRIPGLPATEITRRQNTTVGPIKYSSLGMKPIRAGISTELTNHFHQTQRIARQGPSLLDVFKGPTIIYRRCYFSTGKSPKLFNFTKHLPVWLGLEE